MNDSAVKRDPVLRVFPSPRDINANGHIFGGWILAQMDVAGGITATRIAGDAVATVAIDAMEFIRPVLLGDVISIYAEVARIGRSSMAIKLEVVATRKGSEEVKVTEGLFTFVAIDPVNHRPRAITPENE